MAKVDTNTMHRTLDALVEHGLLAGWQRRPLGMYFLVLSSGDVLRPDTKETAMWVMGASFALASTHIPVAETVAPEQGEDIPLSDGDWDRAETATFFQDLQVHGAIESFEMASDGSLIFQAANGAVALGAREAREWGRATNLVLTRWSDLYCDCDPL